ncbi:FtsX-like permease family protein [Kribbella deserti]|uniref:FtsX-like permease family protein n=1 Tax=Kribbella deserti TaxID=1926257 RepID=A0ABV6QYS2_9ACTN
MAVLRLGLRLAWGSGKARAFAMIVAGLVSSAVLCFLAGFAFARVSPYYPMPRDEKQVLIVISLVIVIPLLILVSTASRLSAASRDRRLASLRLLGLPPEHTRLVSATESAALTVVGAVLGLLVFRITAAPIETAVRARADWLRQPVAVSLGWQVALVAGLVAVTAVVAVLPARAAIRTPLAERQGVVRRPSRARLVPLSVGVTILLGLVISRPGDLDTEPGLGGFAIFVIGAAMTGVGLPLAIPVLVRLIADGLGRRSRRAGVLLAARRLQYEPSSTTRVVAGLVAALFVVAGGRCVLGAWEATPQYIEAVQAESQPQLVPVSALSGDPRPAAAKGIAAVPGARVAAELSVLHQSACKPGTTACIEAIVGTCADLAVVVRGLSGCTESRPIWVVPPAAKAKQYRFDQRFGRPVVVPGASDTTRGVLRNDLWLDSGAPVLFVPQAIAKLAHPEQVYVELPHGTWNTFNQALPPGTLKSLSSHDSYAGTTAEVRGYRAMLWSVGGLALAIGLLALLIGAVDRIAERRRQLATLRAVGVPVGTLRLGQVGQLVLPLLLGIPLAGGLGLLAGSAYLAFAGATDFVPWRSVGGVTLASLVLVLIAATTTLPAIGAKVSAADLRRE